MLRSDRISAKHAAIAFLVLFFIGFLLKYMQEAMIILKILVYAVLFTLILAPLCSFMEKKGIPSSIASALSLLLALFAVSIIIGILLPYMITHSMQLIKRSLPIAERISQSAIEFIQRHSLASIGFTDLRGSAAAGLSKTASWFARSGASVAEGIGQIAFAFIVSYYLLREKSRFGRRVLLLVPMAYRERVLFALKACKNAIMGYLSGMLKTGLFVGGATFLSLAIIGVRDALLLGLLMGILEFIPYIGPIIGAIPIFLSAVPLGLTKCLIILMSILVIQQAESSFIGPFFTSSSTMLHPLTALICVFVFGSLFGIRGILIAVPLFIAVRSIASSLMQTRNLANP